MMFYSIVLSSLVRVIAQQGMLSFELFIRYKRSLRAATFEGLNLEIINPWGED